MITSGISLHRANETVKFDCVCCCVRALRLNLPYSLLFFFVIPQGGGALLGMQCDADSIAVETQSMTAD